MLCIHKGSDGYDVTLVQGVQVQTTGQRLVWKVGTLLEKKKKSLIQSYVTQISEPCPLHPVAFCGSPFYNLPCDLHLSPLFQLVFVGIKSEVITSKNQWVWLHLLFDLLCYLGFSVVDSIRQKAVIHHRILHMGGCNWSRRLTDSVWFTSLNAESTNTWTLCEKCVKVLTHSLWLKYKGSVKTPNVLKECILCILVHVPAFMQERCQLTWAWAHLRCTDRVCTEKWKSCECTSHVVAEVMDIVSPPG